MTSVIDIIEMNTPNKSNLKKEIFCIYIYNIKSFIYFLKYLR